MAVFTKVNPGDPIQAHQLDQVIDALIGTAGLGVPIALTAVNDATNYALTVQNDETGNSRALNVIKSDGTLLIRGDASGVSLGVPLNLTAGSVQTAALADQSVTNQKLGPDVARANLLPNGGFEIWQRGNGPFNVTGQFTADRWQFALAGTDTLSVSKDTTNQDTTTGSQACAACTFTLGTGGGVTLFNALTQADGQQLRNRQVSASVRVRTATANAVRLAGYDGTAWTYSAYHPGDGTYHTLTLTWTPGAAATSTSFGVIMTASCTAYLDNAMLVPGSVSANYVPLTPADELARCFRYFEIMDPSSTGALMISGMSTGASNAQRAAFAYKARKAVIPTVTKNGTWSVSNAGQPIVDQMGYDGTVLHILSVAAGDTFAYSGTAGNSLTVEANP
jgi:hypothetical protein